MDTPLPEPVVAPTSPRAFGALARHFNVTRELAITQFKLKYTGSILGYVWSLVKPLMLFGIMYFVFNDLLGAGRNTPHFAVQLLVGVVLWSFFSETTVGAVNSVVSNGTLVQRAFFPRSILVIATTITATMTFLINMALIIVVATPLQNLDFGLQSLAVIPLLLELYTFILGISLLFAALFVFFRDLGHVWEIMLQALFYASAVVFPISIIKSPTLQTLVLMNPMAQMIEDVRHAIVASGVPWTAQVVGMPNYLIPLGIAVIAYITGVLVFRSTSPRFAENL